MKKMTYDRSWDSRDEQTFKLISDYLRKYQTKVLNQAYKSRDIIGDDTCVCVS